VRLWPLGDIGVDSGHIIVIDPGMVNMLNDFEWYTDDHEWKRIKLPSALSIHTGDGDFDVYAILDDDNKKVGIFIHTEPDTKLPFEVIND
jgi:hypothetical protein